MRRIRRWVRKLITLNGTPRGIAGGFALGLGLSLVPIPFAGMFIALALAPVLRANPVATYFGTFIVNPITGPLIFFFELWLGLLVLNQPLPDWEMFKQLTASGLWDMFLSLLGPALVGVGIVAVSSVSLSYVVIFLLVKRLQRKTVVPPESEV